MKLARGRHTAVLGFTSRSARERTRYRLHKEKPGASGWDEFVMEI